MLKQRLQRFCQGYVQCFKHYDIKTLQNYYQIPCTLSMPDNLILVSSEKIFEQEFLQIYTQLKDAGTTDFSFSDISYTQVNESLTLLGGKWRFFNSEQEIFAEFFACYHLFQEENKIIIVNVMSHEVDHSVTFTEKLVSIVASEQE
ncbi:hypothetical protein ACOYR1_07295 [Thalassotalea piscium]